MQVSATKVAQMGSKNKGKRRGGSGSGSTSDSDSDTGDGRRQRRAAAQTVGRATAKGGGIRRESHRVNLIATNHWDLYGTGASASHR